MAQSVHLRHQCIALTFGLIFAFVLSACGGDDGTPTPSPTPLPDMQASVDNPLVPLTTVPETIFEGEEQDPEEDETLAIRVESRVEPETKTIAGVEVTVVRVDEFENDELVEVTLDYYAQQVDGTVYYLGEDVDEYEDGEVVGHGGAWVAGEDDNRAGVFMPANPAVGDEFEQERAPGVAEDVSTVVEVGLTVAVPAGTFSDCIKTEDLDPLADVTEFKFYCPGVGLVREEGPDGFLELISYQ